LSRIETADSGIAISQLYVEQAEELAEALEASNVDVSTKREQAARSPLGAAAPLLIGVVSIALQSEPVRPDRRGKSE
jgi:hypothetical protein